MADTYTTNLNLTKPEPGAAEDTWGISLNADLDALDAIFSTSGTQINLNPNQINFADNKKAIFGTGSDLQIYHDGNNSHVRDQGTGDILISASDKLIIRDTTDGSQVAVFDTDGAVSLNYGNSTKFATTSTGIDITGRATADGLTSEGTLGNWEISDGGNVQNFTRAGANYIRANNASGLLRFETGGQNLRQKIAANGNIIFYDNTATNESFFWNAAVQRLGLGTTTPSYTLDVRDDSNIQLKLSSTTATNNARMVYAINNVTKWNVGVQASDGSYTFYDNSSATTPIKIESGAAANTFVVDSNSRVGIGTANPLNTLEVSAPASNGIKISSTAPYLFFNDTDTAHSYDGSISQSGTTLYVGGATPAQGIVFRNKASFGESARFDVLGNLLVGTTSIAPYASTSSTAQGISLRGDLGFIGVSRPNNSSAYFNRAGNDGSIIDLRKSGVSVGSIGTKSSELYIGSTTGNDAFLKFGYGAISPSTSAGANSDNYIDLGKTTARFKDLHLSGTAYTGGYIRGSSSDANKLILKASSSITELHAAGGTGLVFKGNGDNERARFDSSGNLLVGKTSADFGGTQGVELRPTGNSYFTASSGNALRLNRTNSDGAVLTFRKDGTTVGSIGTTAGDLLIGTGEVNIRFDDGSDSIVPRTSSGSGRHNAINLGLNTVRFKDLYLAGTAYTSKVAVNTTSPDSTVDLHVSGGTDNVPLGVESTDTNVFIALKDSTTTGTFGAAAVAIGAKGDNLLLRAGTSERARIDSSGNFLVGKTSSSTGVAGARFSANGFANVTRDGGECINFNRLTSDGTIIDFRKDSTTQGNIGTTGVANGVEIYIASGNTSSVGAGLSFANVTISNYIAPCRGDGSYADNLIDLGTSSARFDDIYATNGTIQTSDRNEKQDIQALTDAEQRVATACKGLIRRFRWQDAVEEKGDDARLHFGVIAQDLQDAFTAEGLDAGDYGMFISSTWTDDDGNEQTRLGVRYNELLAFIITTL